MMTRIVVCVLLFLYQTLVVCADAVRSVKNGQELQAAFSDGTKHILITEHLDLTSLNVYDGVGLDDGVLASTGKTLTLQGEVCVHLGNALQGNCTKEPAVAPVPARITKRQCVLSVREDFLEISGHSSRLLLSNVYIQLSESGPDRKRANSLLLRIAEGGMYVANVTLKGDGKSSRGVDVADGARFYAAGSTFVKFAQPSGAAVRMGERSLGSFFGCTFQENVATAPTNSVTPGHGPALALRGGTEGGTYSAAWLDSCTFTANTAAARGPVSTETVECRVFSKDAASPEVFVLSRGETQGPWALSAAGDAKNAAWVRFGSLEFPSSQDAWLTSALQESQRMTGLREELPPTPNPGSLHARRPAVLDSSRGFSPRPIDKNDNDGLHVALIVSLAVLAALLCCGALLGTFCLWRARVMKAAEAYGVTTPMSKTESNGLTPVWRKNLIASQGKGLDSGSYVVPKAVPSGQTGSSAKLPEAVLPLPLAAPPAGEAPPLPKCSLPPPAAAAHPDSLSHENNGSVLGGITLAPMSTGSTVAGGPLLAQAPGDNSTIGGSGFGSTFGFGGPCRPPMSRTPPPSQRAPELKGPLPGTPPRSPKAPSPEPLPPLAGILRTSSNSADAVAAAVAAAAAGGPATSDASLYATKGPALQSSTPPAAPSPKSGGSSTNPEKSSPVAGGYITRLPSLARHPSDSANMPRAESLTSPTPEIMRTRSAAADPSIMRTSSRNSAFQVAAAAAIAASTTSPHSGSRSAVLSPKQAYMGVPQPVSVGKDGRALLASTEHCHDGIAVEDLSPFGGDSESPRSSSLELAHSTAIKPNPPPLTPPTPPLPQQSPHSPAPAPTRARETRQVPSPRPAPPAAAEVHEPPFPAEASTGSMDFAPSNPDTLSTTGVANSPHPRRPGAMPNDPYAAEGPHDARIEARAIHVSPNELSLTQLAQGLAYVPPSAGQNAPFMKERSATDKLVGGVAASDTFATSALIGNTARIWTGRLGTSGMMVPVEERYSDMTGSLMRHRFSDDKNIGGGGTGSSMMGAASIMEVIVTPEELQGMLRVTADQGAVFDGRYKLFQGIGAAVQRRGRNCIVHFASPASPPSLPGPGDVALRFYFDLLSYRNLRDIFSDSEKRECMPIVKDLVPNAQGVATGGHVLPPCVVTRRGENLTAWVKREKPSRAKLVAALAEIAEALAAVHAQGLVYYALKPSDVIHLEGPSRWVLGDFSATMPAGTQTSPMAIMQAAAPEVVRAAESASPVVTADTATDIWALGVLAYELLNSSHVFPVGTPQEMIRKAIFGIEPMPWEENSEIEEISPLQASVALCFARIASQRPTAEKVAETWRRFLRGDDGSVMRPAAAGPSAESEASSGICIEAESSALNW